MHIFEHTQRVAVVTGGARGVGAATAAVLAARGARVVVVDPDWDAAQRLADALPYESFAIQSDLHDLEECKFVVEEVLNCTGGLDILANCGGFSDAGNWPEAGDWARSSCEERAALYVCQAAIEPMCDAGWGRIVNVRYAPAGMASQGQTFPCSSRATGMVALSKGFASPLCRRGITVNTVTCTLMPADASVHVHRGYPIRFGATTLHGPLTYAEETASLIAFLASDAAASITGSDLEAASDLYIQWSA
jgi:NAD(P)-dependent dehydrogenase (short-subunit alcohol dehydrogenase family)